MPRLRYISILLLLFALSLTHYGQAENVVDWKAEIDLLGKELAKRHPNLFFETDSAMFQKAMDRVAAESEGKSVFDISVELQQVLAGMGDAQTLVNYHYQIDSHFILPLECYWFEDGIFILRSIQDYAGLVGNKIVAINGFPVHQIIDSLSTLITARNPSMVKSAIPRMLTWTQLLHHFGFSETTHLKLYVENAAGEVDSSNIELPAGDSESITVEPDSLPLGWQDTRIFFRDLYFPGERIYFIQYNKCWSREAEKLFGSGGEALFMPSFKEFEKKVLKTVRVKEIHKLILDLRHNSGGSSLQGTRLIRRLEKTGIGKKANVYLVVGRRTSSSALINALDLAKAFEVVIMGENSGGKPNHYGEVNRFVLPRSNLVVSCSTRYFTLLDDDPPAIIPDIYTPDTFAGYMKGIDPAFDAIRNHSPR
jgi:hypothetical protein